MDGRGRRNRETSPDRRKVTMQQTKLTKPTFRKVQVLYYLSRNGQLEHPHFMEVSHLANQQLRLKDVVNRLSVLRGRGMPSLFSWSCKRNYRNGYVWNDLSENDVIYPAEGAEYVLKGSEIIEGCAERFQQLEVSNRKQSPGEKTQLKYGLHSGLRNRGNRHEEEEMRYEEEEEEEKQSNSSPYTPHSRCSRGVSTDEMEENDNSKSQNNPTELAVDDCSPPSSSSTLSEKAHNSTSQRFEDCDSGAGPGATRNSVFLQLIACGGSVPATKSVRNSTELKQTGGAGRKSRSLHKGVLCRTAAGKSMMDEEDEINYMSENPRFGNPQSEDKEFFSGSIVESMSHSRVADEPVLKKSTSYNEERSMKSELAIAAEKKEEEEKCLQGKCIPMKRSSYRNSKKHAFP